MLLDKSLEGAKAAGAEVEKIYLNKLKYRGCQECPDVLTDGNCRVKDDMQEVIKKILKADAVIIPSPIFFGSVTGQLKCMIDRFQCYWMGKYIHKTVKPLMKKKGVFLSAQGTDIDKFFQNAKDVVKNLFATIDTQYTAELSCKQIDNKGDILHKQEYIDKAYDIGKKLAQ